MVNAKDYSVKDLQGALKNLKKTSMFNGKVSGLNKSKMISILNDWNYDFSQLSTKVKTTRAPRAKKYGPSLSKGRTYKKLYEKYLEKGNTQLEKAIKAEKSTRAKKFGPKLPRGMTYKNLYETYQKEGNKQLEGRIQNMSRKGKPGRPKGSKN